MTATREAWVVVVPALHQTEQESAELLGEAKRLMGSEVVRILAVGHGMGATVNELATWGADSALAIDDTRLNAYHPDVFARAVAAAVAERRPLCVLFAGTVMGSDLGARVAIELGVRFHDGLLDFKLDGETLRVTRPVAGARQHQHEAADRGPFLLSLVPDTVGPGAPGAPQARTIATEELRVELDASPLTLVDRGFTPADPRTMDIVDASVIVSGGRGAGSTDGFTLIAEVAEQLGGSVGASRPAVEAGWAPYERQVGQTGRTVRPKVYIACGISGASQHLAGMREATTIITINTDSSAPIHGLARLAIEDDLHDVLRALLAQLRTRRTGVA